MQEILQLSLPENLLFLAPYALRRFRVLDVQPVAFRLRCFLNKMPSVCQALIP
jgi:hypothetical protein